MFSGIFTAGQQNEGPKSSNLIAEPAQVMVLVPGSRAQKAENSLASLKNYLVGFAFLFFIVIVLVGLYLFFKRRTKYEARALPGPVKESQKNTFNADHKANVSSLNINDEQSNSVLSNLSAEPLGPLGPLGPAGPKDDIIKISGKLPIWNLTDDTVLPEEPKVSENSNSINALIKSREQLTKHFESLMSNKIISE